MTTESVAATELNTCPPWCAAPIGHDVCTGPEYEIIADGRAATMRLTANADEYEYTSVEHPALSINWQVGRIPQEFAVGGTEIPAFLAQVNRLIEQIPESQMTETSTTEPRTKPDSKCPRWCVHCQRDEISPQERLHISGWQVLDLEMQPYIWHEEYIYEGETVPAHNRPLQMTMQLQQQILAAEPYVEVSTDREMYSADPHKYWDAFNIKMTLAEAETHARHLLELVAGARGAGAATD